MAIVEVEKIEEGEADVRIEQNVSHSHLLFLCLRPLTRMRRCFRHRLRIEEE